MAALGLCLTGCDVDARVKIGSDDVVDVQITSWEKSASSWVDASGQQVTHAPSPCRDLQPYAQHLTLVELHDPGDPDRVGCRATGRVPFAEVAKHQTVGQVAGRYVVAVSASQMHKMLLTSHGTLPNKDSSSISITFPGPVLSASAGGAISGRTVTWSDASAFPWMALEATADRSSMPDLALPLAVVGSGLAGVGLGLLAWRLAARRVASAAGRPEAEGAEP